MTTQTGCSHIVSTLLARGEVAIGHSIGAISHAISAIRQGFVAIIDRTMAIGGPRTVCNSRLAGPNGFRVGVAVLCSAIGISTSTVPANGQCVGSWVQQSPIGTSPGTRRAPAMTYDSVRKVVLLFGGDAATSLSGSREPRGDLWSWDGNSWTMVAPSGPAPRYHARLAFAPSSGRSYLFGGFNGSSYFGDLWAWNGTAWQDLSTSAGTGPSPRAHAAVAFDTNRGRLVVFGGLDAAAATRRLSDTWEFDGTTWHQVNIAGPSGRSHVHLAFDEHRGTCLLVGGEATSGSLFDTWEYDGNSWVQKLATGSPEAEVTTYSQQSQRVLMRPASSTTTFEWTGSAWLQVATGGPSARSYQGLAYDSTRMRCTLYGGAFGPMQTSLSDTWELVLFGLTTQPSNAVGCPSSTATFSLTADGTGPFTYHWRKDGTPIDSGTGGNPSAATATLTLTNVGSADAGTYDCLVTNACGTITSDPARLTMCIGDFNCDGGVDGSDIGAFFAEWEAGNAIADTNADGGIDGADVSTFFEHWEAGC
ncbi:MAG: immunoglobulin domain-containing protein [Planctomycetota bacterium]|nr:immunoglobulin domain-containing protein [Planctomycetota bacterium]